MNQPLVSIIIPTFNRAHLIGETLESILAQNYRNWECIIVDDGSNDNTRDVVDDYIIKDIRFQFHQRPANRMKGANSCRNYGFELCKGEFVNWFDDDDVMLNNFIKEKLECFSDNNLDLVACSGTYTDYRLKKQQDINLKITSYLFKDYVLWNLHILTPSILFRKLFLDNKKLFNLDISRGQETEFFSRLFYKLSDEKYFILDKSLFLYRQHADTKTYKNNKYVESFKESQTIIAIENFKKSIELNDLDLIKNLYFNIIDFFYRGLEKKHRKNCLYIIKKMPRHLFLIDKSLAIKFWFSSYFLLLLNRGSYTIEKYFRKFSFK